MSDKPIVTHIYTADPSAHSFNGKIYVYPSHDVETDQPTNDNGDQYDMVDYHVLSMDEAGGEVTDHGVALHVDDVPWASKQMWAPDCATKNGKYYFYFPARDKDGIFRIGVAVSDKPEGPFKPEENYMEGSYSIDPATYVDDDGQAYMYFGGIWGGQLQCWKGDEFDKNVPEEPTGNGPSLNARVAVLNDDMISIKGDVKEIVILDENGDPIPADDHDRRFFEAAWMNKRNGTYYFSYSTGDSHFLCYATANNPLGPFTYGGRIMEPVIGWTTHHSICEHNDKWYLFHHDSKPSGGVNHLRSVKYKELTFDENGKIETIQPYA